MSLFSKYPYQNFTDYNLDWCIEVCKDMLKRVDDLDGWKDQHEKEYKELKALVDAIYNGGITPALEASIRTWLQNNAASIISDWVKMVFFGLTDSGYFVAYIPEGWEDIVFKTTGYDINLALMPGYGHLVLQY